MPSSHFILCLPSPPAPNPSQHQSLLQWVSCSHEVAKALEFQLQHHSFQRNPRVDLLQNGLVGSPCSPRDSQESSPTPPITVWPAPTKWIKLSIIIQEQGQRASKGRKKKLEGFLSSQTSPFPLLQCIKLWGKVGKGWWVQWLVQRMRNKTEQEIGRKAK